MDKKRNQVQKEIIAKVKSAKLFGIAYVACRVGKIKISLSCLKPKDSIVVAYPEVKIKKSWQDDIKKWKFKGTNIKYTTFMSIKKLDQPCDVFIIDEIHLLSPAQRIAAKDYIVKHKIKKVLGLTGTLNEYTKAELDEALGLPIIAHYPISQAVEDGVITDYRIDVFITPLSTERNILVKWKGGKDFMTSEKMSFDNLSKRIGAERSPVRLKMLRLTRMKLIKESQAKIELTKEIIKQHGGRRVLVFTGLIKVADRLGIPSYHSKSKDSSNADAFIEGKTDKLAVVQQLSTGVTFKRLNTTIINFFDSNGENMAQKISRITCMEYDTPDKIANVKIICSNEEQEKIWLGKALKFFDESKITYIEK